MSAAIEISGICKRYDSRHNGGTFALRDVTTEFPEGQVIGLLGHNGAGKSTLIKLMLGLITPTAGELRVLGLDPGGPESRVLRSRVGYLPENVAFYDNLTGREVLTYLARLKKASIGDGSELLERVGIAAAADRRVRTYSKGMRQRLGLAQVLLGSPDLLLLDEPITGLDPAATEDFFRLMGELRAAGKSIVISSHQLGELEPHLDRAAILGHGHLLAEGSIAELYSVAGLAVTITARFAGGGNGPRDVSASPAALLDGLPVTWRRRELDLLEFDVSDDAKVAAVRRLAAADGLTDIEVRKPTLAHLYETIGAGCRKAEPPAAERHSNMETCRWAIS